MASLFSCDSKFPNYITKEDGVYMKLLSFGEEEKKISTAEYAAISIEMYGEEGLLYRLYKDDVIHLENSKLNFLFNYLSEGDSASFMVEKKKIIKAFEPLKFKETASNYVEVKIKIHRYYTKEEYLLLKRGYDKEMMEQLLLNKYLAEVVAKPYSGIYVDQIKEGEGEKIKKGDIITIAYKGAFIDRLEFDKISGKTAFTFTYGTPGQVIEGLSIGIKGMKKGEKSKIIIPSQLAFGEEGSTTLIVPSFTTVIYELEIINVK